MTTTNAIHTSRSEHIITLLASLYASSRNGLSFLSYFASTTPESEHKRTRLKIILVFFFLCVQFLICCFLVGKDQAESESRAVRS